MDDISIEQEIIILKEKLRDTDYIWMKINEGDATVEYYADLIEKRRNWRQRINDLELEILL